MPETYRLGWVIPYQVMALTHFTETVTPEIVEAVKAESKQLLEDNVVRRFYLLIDNHRVNMDVAPSLREILAEAPHFKHPLLRWVVMILPEHLNHSDEDRTVHQVGGMQLMYAKSLDDALEFLKNIDAQLEWASYNAEFFQP